MSFDENAYQELTEEVITFWFGAPDSAELGANRAIWFDSNPAFDDEIRERFGEANQQAAAGQLDAMMQTQRGSLALIILLDQFSRNIYRGKAEAFANDLKARDVAQQSLDKRFDQGLLTVQRKFMYLPFEHAEDLTLQDKSVELFITLGDNNSTSHALCHRDQIIRFGRFPDRNRALGRKSTLAEQRFLEKPFC
ncbi:DUF924 family protein [Kangiella geojedonensis]|uniref:Transmembrane protein n=1 Tax=Kangiella geojedonensis TaxID=914150 RepID=A0A0F6RBX8_9GAMM|nr:DUF924 family protein [Kangiella geojedonensis]AKE51551.1 hypothetical protein TQ33_0570 [Kangiella geojedonensis]